MESAEIQRKAVVGKGIDSEDLGVGGGGGVLGGGRGGGLLKVISIP